ncbi:MAG: hypothetical protein H6671_04340 [Anaerolineaceae bacterium]|nr:hypothetical protein [Anaerolineaceae bacterium]
MRHKLIFSLAGAAFLLLVGWRGDGLPFIPGTPYSDAAISHWPAAFHLRQAWGYSQFPVWQETIMAGGPFAANPLNKTAYPPQWLALLFSPASHLNLMIGLHLLLAGWGMWRWARAEGLRPEAAALSAAAYMFAPKALGHLGAGHLDLVYALAWWPWLMVSLRDSSLYAHLRTAVFAALLFLADVRLSLFALSIAAAYELWGIAQKRDRQHVLGRLLVVPVFLLLTASVLLPLLGWRPYLNRATLTPEDAGVFSLEPGHLAGLILPAHEGNVETLTYLGLPVLLLAGIALFHRPRRFAFWAGVVIVSLLYALGENGPLWPLLVRLVPGLLWFRVPSRAWFGVVLAVALLAGHGLDTLMGFVVSFAPSPTLPANGEKAGQTGQISRPRWRGRFRGGKRARNAGITVDTAPQNPLLIPRLLAAGGIGVAALCGGLTVAVLPLPASAGLSTLVIGMALGFTLLLALYGRLRPERLALLLLLLVLADSLWTGRQWVTWQGPDFWLTAQAPLAERLSADGAARVYSPTYSLEQQVGAAYGLRLFGGIDPFQLTGIAQAIAQGSGVPGDAYSVILPPLNNVTGNDLSNANRDAVLDTQVLAEWDVSHIVAAYPMAGDRLEYVDTVGGVYIYRNRDYTPAPAAEGIWPSGWPGLPDDKAIADLNNITFIVALVSGIGFFVTMAVLLIFKSKGRE